MSTNWKREAALLGIPDLPVGAFEHVGDRKIKPQGGGSGGGGSTTATSYTSNIPEYAQGPFMGLVGRAEALSNTPYTPFTGQRIEGFNPTQQAMFQRAGSQQTAPQIGMGSGLAAGAATSSFTQPGMAGAYMSPYMQNVVDIQKREANRDAGIAATQRGAQAVKAGAFGGSRQAIMEAEAQRNLQTQLGDIQGKGLQSAFEAGQGQFNAEMNRGLQGAQTLGQLGQTQFGQEMDITQLLGTVGGQQQQQAQRQLDQQYSDFQAQRDQPYQQLGFLSDILRGTAGTSRSVYEGAPQAGGLQTLAGLGTAAAGFGKMFKEGGLVEAAGYAAGGTVNPSQLTSQLATMSDDMLQRYTKMHQEDPYTVSLALSEANRRKQMRQAAAVPQGEQPQGTVVERAMGEMEDPLDGGIAAAVGEDDMAMADGGLVGYADGGETQRYPGLMQYEGTGDTLLPRTTGYEGMGIMEALRAMGGDLGQWAERKGLTGSLADKVARDEAERAARAQSAEYGLGNEGRREPMAPMPAGIAAAVPAETTPMVEGAAPASRMPQIGGTGGIGLRASRSTGAARGGLGALVPDLGVEGLMKEGQGRIDAMAEADRALLEQEQADLLARQKEQGVYGADREKRLQAQEAGLAGKESNAKNMALIEAGLAILSADPRRGGLAAIGEGALKGVGAYKGDMEKIEAQREKVTTQMDELLELRRQEANAQGKERSEIRARIRAVGPAAQRSAFELWKGVGVPLKAEQAKLTFQAALKERELAASRENAQIQASASRGRANATLENAQAYAASKGIPLHQAFAEMGARGGGFDPREAYVEYAKGYKSDPFNPGGQMMSYAQFARQFPPPTVSAVPGQGATIRP